MVLKTVKSQKYIDSRLGPVNIKVLSTARSFTARWKDDVVHLTIPAGVTVDVYNSIVDRMVPDIMAMKKTYTPFYSDGYTFANDLVSIRVDESADEPAGYVSSKRDDSSLPVKLTVNASPGRLTAKECGSTVARIIKKNAFLIAQRLLIAEFNGVASELGLLNRVNGVSISRGATRLGTCNSRGDITLSCHLLMMEPELRRAVMTHELAHLDHMNHSEAFYSRWAALMGGPVRQYRRRYGAAPMPFPKK